MKKNSLFTYSFGVMLTTALLVAPKTYSTDDSLTMYGVGLSPNSTCTLTLPNSTQPSEFYMNIMSPDSCQFAINGEENAAYLLFTMKATTSSHCLPPDRALCLDCNCPNFGYRIDDFYCSLFCGDAGSAVSFLNDVYSRHGCKSGESLIFGCFPREDSYHGGNLIASGKLLKQYITSDTTTNINVNFAGGFSERLDGSIANSVNVSGLDLKAKIDTIVSKLPVPSFEGWIPTAVFVALGVGATAVITYMYSLCKGGRRQTGIPNIEMHIPRI